MLFEPYVRFHILNIFKFGMFSYGIGGKTLMLSRLLIPHLGTSMTF